MYSSCTFAFFNNNRDSTNLLFSEFFDYHSGREVSNLIILPHNIVLNSTYLLQVYFTSYSFRHFLNSKYNLLISSDSAKYAIQRKLLLFFFVGF